MRRIAICVALLSQLGFNASAQYKEGGLPLSFNAGYRDQYFPVSTYPLPDWERVMKQQTEGEAGFSRPYLLALYAASDVGFPHSGILTETRDGHKIWRAAVHIDDAKAIGFYYDRFQLPEGVKYYVFNEKGNQVLGAYTAGNNQADGLFANEPVQGGTVYLELDIDPGVDIQLINLHIDRSAVYFRRTEYLNQYADGFGKLETLDAVDSALDGSSSVCMINAVCPLGSGYTDQSKAVLQQLLPLGQGVAACTGTMINTTGNTTANCKQYFLTASHCEPSNSTNSSTFSQLIVRFNFQRATCTGGIIPESQTLTGANFVARSITSAVPQQINGDFLLLELKQALPASWNVNLSGWNKNANIPLTETAPKKFIGFHHPNGDNKKVSASKTIESTDLGSAGSHWGTQLDSGLVAQGSSGSALFDGNGLLIGQLSAGAPMQLPASCNTNAQGGQAVATANLALYSKFAKDFDYATDGAANTGKLKPWLDPANTGVITLNPAKSNCTALSGGGTGITRNDHKLDDAISLYPNPSTLGYVQVQVNLAAASALSVSVYNINGKRVKTMQLGNVQAKTFILPTTDLGAGLYLLKFSDGNTVSTRKLVIAE